ncbi:hypothetical protein FQR65_LT03563 [Abscondita terminalis]|nr:hypothetical protein FQR65_LT03563 [Abscondita terminalis]
MVASGIRNFQNKPNEMDVITLSSSSEDEEEVPVIKKPKLTIKETTIILSDEDEEEKVVDVPETEPICLEKKVETTDINTNLIVVEPPVVAAAIVVEKEVDEIELKLTAFTNKCLESITLPHIKERLEMTIAKVKGLYDKLLHLECDMRDLECMLDNDKHIVYDSYKAVVRYSEIFEFLKQKLTTAENEELLSGPKRKLLTKLEKVLLILRKRIKRLDEAEVDFDEEENSSYIKASRYKERARRLAYTKLNFTHSQYPEINKLLNKKYKNTIEFPTYFDMDKCIRRHVRVNGIQLSEDALQQEIKFCFEKLGTIMKQRRKLDLYDTHTDFIQDSSKDPASQNEEIEKKLQQNKIIGNTRLEEIYEKYTRMQENGVNPDVSPDSDDSNIEDSD